MKKLIDLTQTIEDFLPVYPGDEEIRLYQSKYLDKDKYNNHRLEISMHSGTHIDGPMHLTERKVYISEIDLDTFIGEGCLIDVRGEQVIEMKEEYLEKVKENSIVLLLTGQSNEFGTDEYFKKYPVVSIELAKFLAEKKIKMLGMDSPSPDKYPFEIHKLLFDKDILVIENLTNLEKLMSAEKIEVIALPLKINADGSIARVVARVL